LTTQTKCFVKVLNTSEPLATFSLTTTSFTVSTYKNPVTPRSPMTAYPRIISRSLVFDMTTTPSPTMTKYHRGRILCPLMPYPSYIVVPPSPEHVLEIVKGDSYLGGQQREGVVVKRRVDFELYGVMQHIMGGKYVTEAFKEVHHKDWAKLNTSKGGLEVLKGSIRTEARWNKAIQHLRDNGTFGGTVKDIGNLIKEVQNDLLEEEKDNLKDQLWKIYGSDVLKSATTGLVDWYKEKIVLGEFQDV
jgi:hypothetical protein